MPSKQTEQTDTVCMYYTTAEGSTSGNCDREKGGGYWDRAR